MKILLQEGIQKLFLYILWMLYYCIRKIYGDDALGKDNLRLIEIAHKVFVHYIHVCVCASQC